MQHIKESFDQNMRGMLKRALPLHMRWKWSTTRWSECGLNTNESKIYSATIGGRRAAESMCVLIKQFYLGVKRLMISASAICSGRRGGNAEVFSNLCHTAWLLSFIPRSAASTLGKTESWQWGKENRNIAQPVNLCSFFQLSLSQK